MAVKRKKEAETLENKGFPLDYLLNWGNMITNQLLYQLSYTSMAF